MANTKITSRVIADDAILTANIADDQITSALIADDVALGGNPTTTTQSAGNNTTRIATTAFVSTAVANIVNSAPSALDTLNELAAALGDDANFSTTITNSIAGKVALSGAGQTIADSGNLTLDVAGDISLDADGEQIRFKDGGTEIGHIDMGSQNLTIRSSVDNKDIEFHGTDGGANIVALKLDMSDAGSATFNSHITINNTGADRKFAINRTGGKTFSIEHDTSGFSIYNVTDSSLHTRFTNTGQVGIGTVSPSAPLHISHGSSTVGLYTLGGYNFQAKFESSDAEAAIVIEDSNSGTDYNRIGVITNDMTFTTNNSEKMRITSQGTIGITGVGSGSLAGSIIINNDGETGTINNAYYNTVLGWEAADDLTSGDSNTIVGNQAGYKLTEATGNTLIGRLAGEQLTTGSYNTAIGFNTMGDAVVTGSSNTAVGNSVMVAVTSGAGNTALGEACAAGLTTGSNNVAIGRSALSNGAVTGNFNIAIGYEALRAVTSGGENICLGRDAGHDVTSAVQNVAIGHESMTKNQSSTANVCIGFQAGENVTGGGNTMIGYKAGEATEGGVYNVFIGENTKGTHPSHSQQIAIGRNIDAAPGQVAIGTSGLGKVYNEFDTDNAWSQGSDERLKQDIKDSALGLDFINDLRPVTYRWKPSNELPETFPMYDEENQRNTDIVMTGLIAQEVKTAIETSGVERFGGWGEDNDGIQQIKKELFIFPLINAVKELTAKLEAAEARIKVLEG